MRNLLAEHSAAVVIRKFHTAISFLDLFLYTVEEEAARFMISDLQLSDVTKKKHSGKQFSLIQLPLIFFFSFTNFLIAG